MDKIGYTRKPDGQNRVPPSTLVPGRAILLANARPDPTLAEFETGPPDSGYSSPHRLPDFDHTYPIMAGLFIRPSAYTRTRHRVIAGRGGSFLQSTWSCVRQDFNFVVQSVRDAPIINTSYQKLPFGSGDHPDTLLFHQALN